MADQYRKKPVTVEAHRWFKNGDHPDDRIGEELPDPFVPGTTYIRQEGAVVRYFLHPDVPAAQECEQCHRPMLEHGWIDTLEGGHTVCPGDYVITGVDGERYPCKPHIFAKTYDRVDETKDAEVQEARRILLQTIAEADRGHQILDQQLKHAQFHTARGTVATLRGIVHLQDKAITKLLHANRG